MRCSFSVFSMGTIFGGKYETFKRIDQYLNIISKLNNTMQSLNYMFTCNSTPPFRIN